MCGVRAICVCVCVFCMSVRVCLRVCVFCMSVRVSVPSESPVPNTRRISGDLQFVGHFPGSYRQIKTSLKGHTHTHRHTHTHTQTHTHTHNLWPLELVQHIMILYLSMLLWLMSCSRLSVPVARPLAFSPRGGGGGGVAVRRVLPRGAALLPAAGPPPRPGEAGRVAPGGHVQRCTVMFQQL